MHYCKSFVTVRSCEKRSISQSEGGKEHASLKN